MAGAQADTGGGVQMRAIAVAIAAQGAARQPVEGIVAERLRVARPAKRAGGCRIATGITSGRPRPGQSVLLIVAERLAVRALGQRRADGGDVAHRIVAQLLVGEGGAVADPAQGILRQPPVVVELRRGVVERRARRLADGGAGNGPERAGCAAVAEG